MNEFDDSMPDEGKDENQELLKHLRILYPPSDSMEQRLARVQHRFMANIEAQQFEQSSLANVQSHETRHTSPHRVRIMTSKDMRRVKRPLWRQRLGTIGAGLCAALVVVGLLVVLNLAHHSTQSGVGHPAQQLALLDASTDWLLTSKAFLYTSDGGLHWKDVTPRGITLTTGTVHMALDASTAWLAVPAADPTKTNIYRTSDGGQSWQSSVVTSGDGNLIIAQITFVSAQDGWILFNQGGIGGAERAVVMRTADGGKTWKELSSVLPSSTDAPPPGKLPFGGTKTGITFLNTSTGWITGSNTVPHLSWLFVTHDGGSTWNQLQLSLPSNVPLASLSLLPPEFFSTTQGILPVEVGQAMTIIYQTHNGGVTWEPTVPLSIGLATVDYLDELHGWVTDGTNLLMTNDGGHTWTKQPANSAFSHVTRLNFVSSTHGWAVVSGDLLLQSMDGGRTWA